MKSAAQEVEFELHAQQARFFSLHRKINLALAGIRAGKTEVGAIKCVFNALATPCVDDEYHFASSPTYPMSVVPRDKLFKVLYDRRLFPVSPLLHYAKVERVFYLATRGGQVTRIKLISMSDPDKARGFKARSWWADEGAFYSDEAWEMVLGRCADADAEINVTTTTNGENWLLEEYEKAREEAIRGVPLEQRRYSVTHWTSKDNPFISRSGVAGLAAHYDAKTFAQEVEALFVSRSGKMYYAFTEALHAVPGRIRSDLPLWVGQDFNVDPMSSVLAQPFTNREGLEGAHILKERVANDSNTYELVKFLDTFIAEHHIPKARVTIYADATGRARKSSSTKSDFKILRAAGYRVQADNTNPPVKDRVNCVNGLFRPMLTRYPRLLVDPGCVQTITSFKGQKWKKGVSPPEPDKTEGFDHLPDGAGYLSWGRWPIRTPVTVGKAA